MFTLYPVSNGDVECNGYCNKTWTFNNDIIFDVTCNRNYTMNVIECKLLTDYNYVEENKKNYPLKSKELDTTFRNVWGGRSLENTKADISEIKYRLTNMYTERVAKIKKIMKNINNNQIRKDHYHLFLIIDLENNDKKIYTFYKLFLKIEKIQKT